MTETELRSLTVLGASFAMIGQGVVFTVNLASIVILSRLLPPQEFGMFAVLMSITAFVDIFKDLGLSAATVQRRVVSDEEISALFWVTQCVGLLLAVLMASLAPVISNVFSGPALGPATAAISVVFVLSALAGQHQALLRRQMRVKTLMSIDIAAKVVGNVVAVISAIEGLGLWSLVLLQITSVATVTLGAWLACAWRPSRPRCILISSITPMLHFGGGLTLSTFLNYLLRNVDNLIIGRFLGSEALGYYSRAYSVMLFPLSQVTGPLTVVAVPALSRLQDDPARYRRYYLAMLKVVAHVSMPLVACMGALSHEIIWLALGPQWSESATLFQILAFATFWTPVGATTGWIYMSLGQTHRMAAWTAIMTLITIVAFIIGAWWGVRGVAIAYSTIISCQIVPQFWFALRRSPIDLWAVLRIWGLPIFTSVTIVLGILMIKATLDNPGPLVVLGGGLLWAGMTWTISLVVDKELLDFLQNAVRSVRNGSAKEPVDGTL